MRNENGGGAGYRPAASGPMKLYLVRHKSGVEVTVHGRNKYEAATAAARLWGARWTSVARESEFLELETVREEKST